MNLSVTLCVDLLDDEEADEISLSGLDEIKTKGKSESLFDILISCCVGLGLMICLCLC